MKGPRKDSDFAGLFAGLVGMLASESVPVPQRFLAAFGALSALLAGVSCGGSDDSSSPDGAAGSGSNVDFAASCPAPPACGGDPMGDWDLVDACVEPPASGFECTDWERTAHGASSGSVYFGAGSFSMFLESELRQCGGVDASDSGDGGTYVIVGDTLEIGGARSVGYCVEGDELWLVDSAAEYPDFRVLHFERAQSEG